MGKGQHAPCTTPATFFISYKENTTMAIQNKLVDMKLQIRVEDTSTGETKVKNLNFTRIKCAATNDELYAAANAIAALQSRPLSGIRTVATGDLADAL